MIEKGSQYTVLARRFRPQSFDEVVGQEHVGQAIRNAIRSGRIAHAYLFTGARGVGKTSTARIFAKALNCPHVKDGIPCNACDVCDSIGSGSDVDVLEIDGASNRGIDDIRQLRANVNVRSMRSPYKVYIIDEVHMLTKEAFNALLKTLEEPPPNVKFVFCTTEPNKLPDTILSRCQRFDFGTIAQASIAQRLKQIAEAEGKLVDDEAVELVARRAAGSMRDSQSLFDQLLAFGGEQITASDVHQLLGTAADERLVELVDCLIAGNPANALSLLEEAAEQGVQIGSFSDQLLNYFRDLLVTAAGATTVSLTAVADRKRDDLQRQTEKWGVMTISAAMQILAETKSKMQRVNYGRALLELAFVRISLLEQLDLVAQLAKQVSEGKPLTMGTVPRQTTSISPSDRRQVEQPRPQAVEAAPSESSSTSTKNAGKATASDVSTPPAPQVFPLNEENLSTIWSLTLSKLPQMLGSHLKNAAKTAISGPNLLEITFTASYLFSKSYCERPETLKRIAAVVSEHTETAVEIRCLAEKSDAPAKTTTKADKPKKTVETRKVSVVDDDEFVQSAVSIFDGEVVQVRTAIVNTQPVVEEEAEDPE